MPPGIKCQTCKQWNRVGTLYCHGCGGKLKQRITHQRDGSLVASLVRGLVRLVVGVTCIGTLGLMLWPVHPQGDMGDAEDGERFLRRADALQDAVREGVRSVQACTEAEINSYLANLISKQAGVEKPGLFHAGTAAMNVTFTPHSLVALIIGAYGPLYLTYEIQGLPVAGEEGFEFDLQHVRLGHLPLPDALGDIMVGRAAHMFSNMVQEKELLDSISKFQVEDGRIVAGVK